MAGEANGKTQRKRVASPPPGEEEKLPLLGGDPDPAKAIAQLKVISSSKIQDGSNGMLGPYFSAGHLLQAGVP
uniref:Uncharacterized protein n=1 Tax=Oryza sativa subsp. japonica TaxID=39947 RepID=Q5Z662_ORYSJ|nr:hypothetical protein [Oryza sativa Japonica Group]BAD54529.1 hypothetical protein [Oryza sativa Japonica Group]